MKRILKLAVIIACLIIPLESLAATTTISDSELAGICAQVGSVTVKLGEIPVDSQYLKSIATDGWNYWDPDHDRTNHFKNPHPNNAEGYFDGTTTTNPQKYPGAKDYDEGGYFGYDEVYLTGGTVIHSGSMTMEVVSTNDPNVKSQCKLEVVLNNSTIDARIGVLAVLKLSQYEDLSGNQSLGRVYTEGIKSTSGGHLSVYANNNIVHF